MSKETVTMSKKEYEQLKHDSWFLVCLMQCGVDNWDGWDDACEMLRETEAEEVEASNE